VRAYRIERFGSIDGIVAVQEPEPEPGPGQVLIRVHARALNRRDLFILGRSYPVPARDRVVPVADGAGTVLATGDGVLTMRSGDQVMTSYFPLWHDGPFRPEYALEQFGCSRDGTLADCVLADESALVRIPAHLSFEEAATLPCAALTAWSALTGRRPVLPGETVLTIGTGGVALFAVQFARLMGARVIAITATEDKAAVLTGLGAEFVVNRIAYPEWQKEVQAHTDGGADHVVETGGLDSLARSIASCAPGGHIALAAALGAGQVDARVLAAPVTIRRFYVGSRAGLELMNAAVAANRLRPVIDSTFALDEAKGAYRRLQSGKAIGKVVVTG
jgi:NADPH:quinone reductase-like Zn-dependent oxidoreductase